MKRNFLRAVATVIAVVLLTAMVSGCKKDADSMYVPPEYIFIAESTAIKDAGNFGYLVVFGNNKFYFATEEYDWDEDNPYISSSTVNLNSINIDGTGFAKLPNYKHPAIVPEGANGGSSIEQILVDDDGFIWVVERWFYFKYNVPDNFDYQTQSPWEYPVDEDNGIFVRKLDSTGAELSNLDLSAIRGNQEYFYIQSFGIDASGNLYISSNNPNKEGQIIYILDQNGSVKISLESENYTLGFVRISDGTMVTLVEIYDENNYSRILRKIDLETRSLGESYELPYRAWQLLPGGGFYDLLYVDNGTVYGFNLEQEEPIRLINWLESDVFEGDIRGITMLAEDHIICINTSWDNMTGELRNEVLNLTKILYSELPKKEVIVLATFNRWSVYEKVIQFNRENQNYRIHIVDYSEFNSPDDWNAGRTRLSTDLTSGNIPDILDTSSFSYKVFVGKGLFADLYKLIDADPDLSRSDLLEDVFKAAEYDGKLFQVFSSFSINTIVGNPAVLGSETGWNMAEFQAVLAKNPKADIPLGSYQTKTDVLRTALSSNMDNYINWERGTTNFDSEDFIGLLEFINTFPDDIDYNVDMPVPRSLPIDIPQEEAIATGRQIMQQITIFGYWDYMQNKNLFGGELVFKGFPAENRKGTSILINSLGLSILDKSPNKDAAWSFVRTVLDKDEQLSSYGGDFLTNKAAFEQKAKESMQQDFDFPAMTYTSDGGYRYDWENYVTVKLTQNDVDLLLSAIASAGGTSSWYADDQDILDIINEEVADFFSGSVSVQNAARHIQNRVSTLVSERS